MRIALISILTATAWAQCSMSPVAPIGVLRGACVQLSASCGQNVTWSVSGDGTIDQNGRYCAPSSVFVQNYSRGAQQLPNNSYINRPVQNDPVHPSSQQWVTRYTSASQQQAPYVIKLGGAPRYNQNFFNQHSDESTPTQKWHAVYTVNYQDATAPIVQPPFAEMQAGLWQDPYGATTGGTGPDRHNFDTQTLSTGFSVTYEQYQLMPDSHNTVFTPGNPTTVAFDTNLNLKMPTKWRMQVNGVAGCSSINNFNGYASSSYILNLVSQVPATNGYLWHVVATIPANTSSCSSSSFSSAYLAGSSSNCQTCNTGTMAAWPNWSNTSYRSTTAGGLPIIASAIDPVQWYSNVKNNIKDPSCKGPDGQPRVVAASHQLGFTLPNNMISPLNLGAGTTGDQVTGGHPRMQIASMTMGNPIQVSMNYNLGTSGLDLCEAPTPWLGVPATGSCSFHVVFQGLTGSCAALNDNTDHSNAYYATSSDQRHFTIPVDGSAFSGCTFNGNQWVLPDWAPYGSVWRIDTARLNPDTVSDPYEKAVLWGVACYGLALDDGTNGVNDSLNVRILSNGFYPDELVNAANLLKTLTVGNFLVVVDPIGTMPLNGPGKNQVINNELLTTNFRRTTVTVTGSTGSSSADLNLVGTVVGIDANGSERLPVIYPGFSFKPTVLVTGSNDRNFTCSFETPVTGATVDSDCTVHAPASLTQEVAYKIKAVSSSDPSKVGYASGYFVPASSDGALRLGVGQIKTSYTDSTGQVWWGQTQNRQWSGAGQVFQSPLGCLYCDLYGTFNSNPSGWSGVVDGQLYGSSVSNRNDAAVWAAVPNGTYNVTLLGEAGLGVNGSGGSVADYEINGTVVDSWVDTFVRAGGTYKPYQHVYPVTVSNGVLSIIARDRQDSTSAVYGVSPFAAIKIAPSGPPPPSRAITLSGSSITGAASLNK